MWVYDLKFVCVLVKKVDWYLIYGEKNVFVGFVYRLSKI